MRAVHSVRRSAIAALALVATGALFTVAAAPANAAGTNRYVAKGGDDFPNNSTNDCTVQASPCATIQHAVTEASSGDTINVGAGTYAQHVVIPKDVTIIGAGVDQTVVNGGESQSTTTCGGRLGPTILIDGANVAVNVTLKDISVDGNDSNDGVQVCDAALTMVDSSASTNHGDGVIVVSRIRAASANVSNSELNDNGHNGLHGEFVTLPTVAAATVDQSVTLTVSNSDLSRNTRAGVVGEDGSAIAVDHSTINRNHAGGVVAQDTSSATVSTSTLDQNLGAGAVAFGSGASLHLSTSTVSNSKPFGSETGDTFGSGVIVLGASGDVTNSTLVGNTAQGVLDLGGTVTVTQTTINGTKPTTDKTFLSGGLVLDSLPQRGISSAVVTASRSQVKAAAAPAPSLTVTGSIDANQGTNVPDCAGNITDGGYNLSSDANNSCKFTTANHDLPSTDPKLDPLADNGGPTQTELLAKGSPAIDAVASGQAGCTSGATDQRGVARPQPTGGACDMGAVELKATALAIHPDSLPHGTVGKQYSQQLTATGGQYPSYTFAFAGGQLPPGLTLAPDGKISGKPTKAGTFKFTVSVNDPVFKDYTIVIDEAATEPISNTGSHTGEMLAVGAGAIFAGFLMMLAAGAIGRRPQGPKIVRRPIR